jgi:hypothetical protein
MYIKYHISFVALLLMLMLGGIKANQETLSDRYVALALQGDLGEAQALFSEIEFKVAPIQETELANRFDARFIAQSENLSPGTGDEFADAVVVIYRDYWVRTLTGRLSFDDGERFLERSLLELLGPTARADLSTSPSDIHHNIGVILQEKGFFYLDTPAPPLHDLFLWTGEENKDYTVRLTDHSQAVRVTFMTGIYSRGWKEFATLGLVSTSGWVEGARLYCVNQTYDRETENFRISYLKHESRHLADFERFPGLPSAELEYRAKLTELAFASASLRSLLDDFTIKSSPNPESPHTFANYRVTRDIYLAMHGAPLPGSGNPWLNVDTSTVNKTARELLKQNSAKLEAAGR